VKGLKAQTTVLRSGIGELLKGGRTLMELAERRGWPVLFHTSVNPGDPWAQVGDCLAVAEAFPGVRFNLAHSLRFWREGLERAARLPNVWVDCSAHLNHCTLALRDSASVAVRGERVGADYSDPVGVLRVVHEMMGGRYLWGSDNPFMSWCDDKLRLVFSYKQEADVLHGLPERVKLDMAHVAPRAWLGKGAV
jgi:predicted TIM-barrel fold metal-dependent hydrolase